MLAVFHTPTSVQLPVLLGTDVAELHQLLSESTAYPQVQDCMMISMTVCW